MTSLAVIKLLARIIAGLVACFAAYEFLGIARTRLEVAIAVTAGVAGIVTIILK